MNAPVFAIPIFVAAACTAISRDLAPPYWIENIEATDTSIQQSLVFTTTRGVLYTVERSHDLIEWTTDETFGLGGEIYGMSHDCVVPMRQFTPPTSPPPGGGTPPEGPPPLNVSIRFQRCISGGTVATWPAISGSGSVSILLTGEMDDAWDDLPLFWKEYGGYRMFIWHPVGTVPAPPAQTFPLEDEALRDALVEHFAEINNEVDLNQAMIRNAPPPAPPSPDSKVFWRIRADWSIDTDDDGSLDWAEFELMDDSEHPSHVLADPFEADTDNNGVEDGSQIDFDNDGTKDRVDPIPFSSLVSLPVTPTPRYAYFRAYATEGYPKKPIQISDQGTILFSNRTWRAGRLKTLSANSGEVRNCQAYAINDFDGIIGAGQVNLQENPELPETWATVMVHWISPDGDPSPIQAGEDYAIATEEMAALALAPGSAYSQDAKFIAYAGKVQTEFDTPRLEFDPRTYIWSVGLNGIPADKGDEVFHASRLLNQYTRWGTTYTTNEGVVTIPDGRFALSRTPVNVVFAGNTYHAFYDGQTYPSTFSGGFWKTNHLAGYAIDISRDGTMIAKSTSVLKSPMLVNGKLQSCVDLFGEPPAYLKNNPPELFDTTPSGWVLAHQGPIDDADELAAMMPLRLKGRFEGPSDASPLQPLRFDAAGVDDVSMTSSARRPAIKNRIWIMAPIGDETEVEIQAPIEFDSPLEISGSNLKFDGQDKATLTESENLIGISANQNLESGTEILLDLTLKNVRGNGEQTVSTVRPIAVKAMKRRTLSIKAWIVRYDDGQLPDFNPTAKQISDYLNGIFGPQINLHFDCAIQTVSIPGGWDKGTTADYGGLASNNSILPGNRDLDVSSVLASVEMNNITQYYKDAGADINLYIIGGAHLIRANTWIPGTGVMHRLDAGGIAMINSRTCWIAGMGNRSPVDAFETVSHEIGHLIFGSGHPNSDILNGNSDTYGPAPLPNTNMTLRLMCDGGKNRFHDGRARNIVKEEWDRAEITLRNVFQQP